MDIVESKVKLEIITEGCYFNRCITLMLKEKRWKNVTNTLWIQSLH